MVTSQLRITEAAVYEGGDVAPARYRTQRRNGVDDGRTNLTISKEQVRCRIADLIKTSKAGSRTQHTVLDGFRSDRRLCVVKYLKANLQRTKPLRGEETSQLKPHAGVSRDTLRQWTKLYMQKAGIDTSIFTPHSTRAADSSKALEPNLVSLKTINKTAWWKRNTTFTPPTTNLSTKRVFWGKRCQQKGPGFKILWNPSSRCSEMKLHSGQT